MHPTEYYANDLVKHREKIAPKFVAELPSIPVMETPLGSWSTPLVLESKGEPASSSAGQPVAQEPAAGNAAAPDMIEDDAKTDSDEKMVADEGDEDAEDEKTMAATSVAPEEKGDDNDEMTLDSEEEEHEYPPAD